MTIEKEAERDDLRALLKFPQIGLPEYSADPIVQRRFGSPPRPGEKSPEQGRSVITVPTI
jgi:hypothetical protein